MQEMSGGQELRRLLLRRRSTHPLMIQLVSRTAVWWSNQVDQANGTCRGDIKIAVNESSLDECWRE
jgi:hypothetical protein